jgi:Uma2 family endonuclease
MVTTLKKVEKTLFSKPPRLYTLAQYMRKEENTLEKHEFYNGKIVKMPNAKFYHNLIISNIARAINNLLDNLDGDYYVLAGGQKVYVEAENVALYPDALVISEKPQFYEGQQSLLTNPIVIIEVLSKSTAKYDCTDKFNFYKSLSSFKEYVLIDQKSIFVETRFQEAPDVWRYSTYKANEAEVLLRSLRISVKMDDIYKKVVF